MAKKKKLKLKKKNFFILICSLIVFISLCIGGYFYYDKVYLNKINDIIMSLNGDEYITLNLNDEYNDDGAKATFRKEDITNNIIKYSNLKSNEVGDYVIDYKVEYLGKEKKVTRFIKVKDNISPEITLNGKENISIYIGTNYKDEGAKAIDNYDGDITNNISVENNIDINNEGKYTIKYSIMDSSGNSAEIIRNIEVKKRPIVHRNGVAVLNYHFFSINGNDCGTNCISINKFEEHLKYLKENNFKALTMEEFRKYMYNEIEIPEKSVLITIDDGAAGTGKHNGNLLIPMLENYQMHATLFLITGWWSIENYRSPYLDIESHTHNMHTENYCQGVQRGAKMLCLSKEEVIADLKQSVAVTNSTNAFCYPFYVYNEQAVQALQEVGFKLAFAGGGYKATRYSNKYAIPRFHITSNITLDEFISMVA